MNFGTVKLGAHVLGALGVTKVVGDIIARNSIVNTTWDVVRIRAGSIVIGSLIAEHASQHVEDRMNQGYAWWMKNRNDNNNPPNDPPPA